jgi:hypothetical protein
MLPELISMACTAYGKWGKATATGPCKAAATFCSLPQVPHLFLLRFLILITGEFQSGIGIISEKV